MELKTALKENLYRGIVTYKNANGEIEERVYFLSIPDEPEVIALTESDINEMVDQITEKWNHCLEDTDKYFTLNDITRFLQNKVRWNRNIAGFVIQKMINDGKACMLVGTGFQLRKGKETEAQK